MSCKVIQVIETDLELRGRGTEDSVLRRIQQYYTLDGQLLWESDPVPDAPKCNFDDGHYIQHGRLDGCGERAVVEHTEIENSERVLVLRRCEIHKHELPRYQPPKMATQAT